MDRIPEILQEHSGLFLTRFSWPLGGSGTASARELCWVLLLTCMVSYTAMPAVTTPPGELMYMLICMQQTCDRSHPEEGV